MQPEGWPGHIWLEGRTSVHLRDHQTRPSHMPRGPAAKTGEGFLIFFACMIRWVGISATHCQYCLNLIGFNKMEMLAIGKCIAHSTWDVE